MNDFRGFQLNKKGDELSQEVRQALDSYISRFGLPEQLLVETGMDELPLPEGMNECGRSQDSTSKEYYFGRRVVMDESYTAIWNTEYPKECGYYLVLWGINGDGRRRRISEFWYDGSNWWSARPYIDEEYYEEGSLGRCMTDEFIAWTRKPEKPKIIYT